MKITNVERDRNMEITHFQLSTQKGLDALCLSLVAAGFKPVLFTDIDFTLNRGGDTLYVHLVNSTAKLIKTIQ